MVHFNRQSVYKTLLIPALFVVMIWVVYIIEIQFGYNFNKYGVYPRTVSGLKGLFFSTFIHSSTSHLMNNTIPLFVLLSATAYFYKDVFSKVLIYGILLTEFGTWLIGRPAFHIGASGLIYLLFSFIFFSGIFKKYYKLIAVSLIVIFLYGSMIWFVLPIKEQIS